MQVRKKGRMIKRCDSRIKVKKKEKKIYKKKQKKKNATKSKGGK